MIGSAMTKMRWLQMISIKDCGKLVNGSSCPCANKLRLVILRIPLTEQEEKHSKMDILKHQIDYNKCCFKEKYPY